MTEQERIDLIKQNGGTYLKRFKPHNITYRMCLEAVTLNGRAVYYVPEQFLTKEIYTIACKTFGDTLRYMPNDSITLENCLDAVKTSGQALRYVPLEYLTEEVCFEAVCADQKVFGLIPRDFLTPLFCARVIENKGAEWIKSIPEACKKTKFYAELINLIPKELVYQLFSIIPYKNRTEYICKEAIRNLGYTSTTDAVAAEPRLFVFLHPSLYDHDVCLEYVRSEEFKRTPKPRIINGTVDDYHIIGLTKILQYYDVCIEALQINGYLIDAVPPDLITNELCLIAVKTDGKAVALVPEKYKTKEIYETAFNSDALVFDSIPDGFKTPQMCLIAVKESGYLLKNVPEEMKTHEICRLSVLDKGTGFDYIPTHLLDKELVLLAINNTEKSDKLFLNTIPVRLMDYEVCFSAVRRDSAELRYVPDELKDYEMCLIAAKKGEHVAEYIPYNFLTPEVCFAIAKRSASDLRVIPKELLTTEVCLEAVKHFTFQGGTVIGDIPRHLLTQEMCVQAVKTASLSFVGIPEEFVTEDVLVEVARKDPRLLFGHLPLQFRTQEFINGLIRRCPWLESYVRYFFPEGIENNS